MNNVTSELGLFETVHTTRAMRRLKPDAVPDALIHKVLDAGIRASSGQNSQPWAFVVVREPAAKRWFGERYHAAMLARFSAVLPAADDDSPDARTARAAMYLAEHMHEVPVLLVVCGKRDWPFAVPAGERKGKAPPSYGSVYPCVQNILLACRALGLGASLTTMHQLFEDEWRAWLGIPEDYGVVSVIPVGWPEGKFGPVSRRPVEAVAHAERWGTPFTSEG